MRAPRNILAVAAFAASSVVGGCALCGADEELAVTFSAPDSLSITRDGSTHKVEFVTRLIRQQVSAAKFEFVFNTIDRTGHGVGGIALTLSGIDPVSDETVVLVLALPVSLQKNQEYTVGRTFSVNAGEVSDPQLWGPHNLAVPNQAEAAFTVAAYTFPPPQNTTTFRAVSASGTVRITDRKDGWVELLLDLDFVDSAGKTARVNGKAQATTSRYTPPCT